MPFTPRSGETAPGYRANPCHRNRNRSFAPTGLLGRPGSIAPQAAHGGIAVISG
jgi:hypothetical protein